MFKYAIYTVIIALSLAAISCDKNNDNNNDDNSSSDPSKKEKVLTQMTMTTPLASNKIDISYNSALQIEKTIEKEGSNIKKVSKYSYNGSLLLDCKWYSDEAMTNQIGSNTYTFNASGEMTKMIEIDGADTTTYTISWNSGKLSEYTAINILASFKERHVFEWNGDNASKETIYALDTLGNLTMIGYKVYSYDDKINPLTIKYVPEIDDVSFMNKNNILKIENYNALGVMQSISQFTYSYDEKGYPVSGTFDYGFISGQYSYTYSELEKE